MSTCRRWHHTILRDHFIQVYTIFRPAAPRSATRSMWPKSGLKPVEWMTWTRCWCCKEGGGVSRDTVWTALTSSSDDGFAKETETTGGALAVAVTVGAGLSCASVGRVSMLPLTACGVWICSTCPVRDSMMGRPVGGRRQKTRVFKNNTSRPCCNQIVHRMVWVECLLAATDS